MTTHASGTAPRTRSGDVAGAAQCPRCASRLLFDGNGWNCTACGYESTPGESSTAAVAPPAARGAKTIVLLLLFGVVILGLAMAMIAVAPARSARLVRDAARRGPGALPRGRGMRLSMLARPAMRDQQHVHPTDQQDRRGRHPR